MNSFCATSLFLISWILSFHPARAWEWAMLLGSCWEKYHRQQRTQKSVLTSNGLYWVCTGSLLRPLGTQNSTPSTHEASGVRERIKEANYFCRWGPKPSWPQRHQISLYLLRMTSEQKSFWGSVSQANPWKRVNKPREILGRGEDME